MADGAHKLDIRSSVSAEEWQARVDLAALYRLIAMHGWDDLIFTHISHRVPGPDHHFLINPYGYFFEEITASSLVKVDLEGNVVQETDSFINPAGFTIHSAIHDARDDAQVVIHVHTDQGVAVSAQKEGLMPLSQTAMIVREDIAYHDYEGIALDLDERERLVADLEAFKDLPATPLEPCEKRAARVSSTALVRYRCNDYSVPTSFGFRDVLVKGFVDEVVILCAGEEIARHRRSYATGTFVFDPLHYLMLLEMKPNALDQAAPLQGWDLPETFQHLRHLLEARMGNRGKREFIQVLRLMEAMPMGIVAAAVTEAIRLGAIGFDAVKLIALSRIERRPLRLDLSRYPHLPKMDVRTTAAADYAVLVPGKAA